MTTATTTAKKNRQLSKKQQDILYQLAKSKRPLTRKQLVVKCQHTPSAAAGWYTIDLGATDPQARKRNDVAYYPSLLTRRYITIDTTETHDGKEVIVYDITEKGLAALRALPKKTTS